MKVYVLMNRLDDAPEIQGVFSTLEAAKAAWSPRREDALKDRDWLPAADLENYSYRWGMEDDGSFGPGRSWYFEAVGDDAAIIAERELDAPIGGPGEPGN